MPSSYWSIAIAAVGCLTLGAVQTPSQHAKSREVRSKSGLAPASRSPSADTFYRPYPDWRAEACYQAQSHDTADLCAQWRSMVASEEAAHEARRSTTWAIVGTLLSGLALAGLGFTLWQTQGSLAQARRSNLLAMKTNARATRRALLGDNDTIAALAIAERNASAANRQAEISQDTARRQLRAYMGPVGAVIEGFPSNGSRVVMDIKNFGQTPARLVGAWIFYRIEKTKDASLIGPHAGELQTPIGMTEPQHTQNIIVILPHGFFENDVPRMATDEVRFYITAVVRFQDDYGVMRWRRFSYYLARQEIGEWKQKIGLSIADLFNDEGEGNPPSSHGNRLTM